MIQLFIVFIVFSVYSVSHGFFWGVFWLFLFFVFLMLAKIRLNMYLWLLGRSGNSGLNTYVSSWLQLWQPHVQTWHRLFVLPRDSLIPVILIVPILEPPIPHP